MTAYSIIRQGKVKSELSLELYVSATVILSTRHDRRLETWIWLSVDFYPRAEIQRGVIPTFRVTPP
jgi:hypothetical protein